MYLRDGSAQAILRAAILRWKLQIELSTSPTHSILTPGRPVPALTLERQAPGRVATGVPMFKSLVWLDREKSRRQRDSNPGSSALEADALTTRPTRRFLLRVFVWKEACIDDDHMSFVIRMIVIFVWLAPPALDVSAVTRAGQRTPLTGLLPPGVCLLVGCLTSQQHASVSQGRICSDNFTCCDTEIEVAFQTFHLTQSQYTDTGPTSPSTDPITSGAWQGNHWSAFF